MATASRKASAPKAAPRGKGATAKAKRATAAPKAAAASKAKPRASAPGKSAKAPKKAVAAKPAAKVAAAKSGKSTKAKAAIPRAATAKGAAANSAAANSAAANSAAVKATRKPAAKAAAPKRGPKKTSRLPHVDDKTLDQIILRLNEMRSESQHVVNDHVQADLKQREESSEVGDDMDQASNERDREFSLIIHQRHLRRLKQIEDAFDRIEDGSYGLCEGTEEPINPKRLLIMPLARFSLEYQQQQEKMLGRSPEDALSGGDDSMISDE